MIHVRRAVATARRSGQINRYEASPERRSAAALSVASALRKLDPFYDPATAILKKPYFDAAEVEWEVERDFPEVDARLMLDTDWKV